jgi:hypothetical protein
VAASFAVGIVHLDSLAAAEPPVQHRYCTQVLAPLLATLRRRPAVRLSIAAAGVALEFVAASYPAVLDSFKRLSGDGQVELVSSGYGPTAWPVFPGSDLRRSIKMGEEVSKGLGLRPGRAFLPHEGSSGAASVRCARGLTGCFAKTHTFGRSFPPPRSRFIAWGWRVSSPSLGIS